MKKLFAFLFLALMAVMPSNAKIYCLVTGVSNYEGEKHDLNVSTDDAKRLTNFYRSRGAKVQLLTGKYATSENIVSYIRKVAKASKAEDQMVFYFSGHGYENHLLTYDEVQSLDYADLFAELRKVNCSNLIIFIDACFSGSMHTSTDYDGNESLNRELEAHVGNNEKFIIFSSSRNYEMSYESGKGGLFTDALLRGMQGAADTDKNKEITTIELFSYVHGMLGKNLRKSNVSQHPTLVTNVEKNQNVVIMRLDE